MAGVLHARMAERASGKTKLGAKSTAMETGKGARPPGTAKLLPTPSSARIGIRILGSGRAPRPDHPIPAGANRALSWPTGSLRSQQGGHGTHGWTDTHACMHAYMHAHTQHTHSPSLPQGQAGERPNGPGHKALSLRRCKNSAWQDGRGGSIPPSVFTSL